MQTTRGVIFAATGAVHVAQARHAAASVRRHCPGLEIDLFTDDQGAPGMAAIFDRVHLLPAGLRRPKIRAMQQSRFDLTLWLDADLRLVADVRDIFDLLDRFDLALAHDPLRNSAPARRLYRSPIPDAFPQMAGGVVGLRRTPQVLAFLEDWDRAFQDHAAGVDQPSLRELLWQSDLRVAVLPPEYNLWDFRSIDRMGPEHAAPRILHAKLFILAPKAGGMPDEIAQVFGASRAARIDMLISADHGLAARAGRSAQVPTGAQNLRLAAQAMLDMPRRLGQRLRVALRRGYVRGSGQPGRSKKP